MSYFLLFDASLKLLLFQKLNFKLNRNLTKFSCSHLVDCIKYEMDSYGNDITGLFVQNYLECRDHCLKDKDCKMYRMWISSKLCWLKHSILPELTYQSDFIVTTANCTGEHIFQQGSIRSRMKASCVLHLPNSIVQFGLDTIYPSEINTNYVLCITNRCKL